MFHKGKQDKALPSIRRKQAFRRNGVQYEAHMRLLAALAKMKRPMFAGAIILRAVIYDDDLWDRLTSVAKARGWKEVTACNLGAFLLTCANVQSKYSVTSEVVRAGDGSPKRLWSVKLAEDGIKIP